LSFDPEQDFDTTESPTLLQRIVAAFSRRERWRNLNWAIAAYPHVAANYVLRGELLLKQGDMTGAIGDFQHALDLAMADVEKEDWGVVAQNVQDRALVGLRDALNRSVREER